MGKPTSKEVSSVTAASAAAADPPFPFFARGADECFAELGCPPEGHAASGLSSADASSRLEEYGPNTLTAKARKTIWQRIWHHVANMLVGILVVVAVVSVARAFTSTTVDNVVSNALQAALIVLVITINTIIGLIQEGSAEKAAEALKAMLSAEAVAVRDGKEVKVPADTLVPGDVVMLNQGDRVPADVRLLRVSNFATLEAALTGEPVPINKKADAIAVAEGTDPMLTPLGDRNNMCFSATLVSSGTATGLVVATGDRTEIGTINALVNKVEHKKTNVLEQIDRIASYIAVVILFASIATWLVAYYVGGQTPIDAVSSALICAVAMIPEGLEAIVTVTYGWAVSNMAKKNAIIRALPAVETLGSVTVLMSDKTGTLTKNEMTMVAFVTTDARWRFDVNASERTVSNFWIDHTYMATRADHTRMMKASDVIRSGPSAVRRSRSGRAKTLSTLSNFSSGRTFPFGMTVGFGKTAHGGIEPEEPTPIVADDGVDDTFAVLGEPKGESPDSTYLRQALAGGILCSKCVLGENGGRVGEIGNPTELSILRAAYLGGVDVSEVKESATIIAEVPFSSEYKFMATVHEPVEANDTKDYLDDLVVHVKGAPDRMIPLCKHQARGGSFAKADLEPCDELFWIEQIAILSSHGLRVLALTRGTVPRSEVSAGQQLGPDFVLHRGEPWLTIVGLCAIMDPPRPECVQAVKEAKSAGVRIGMITGDHRDTALAIGFMLGLVDKQHSQAITGPEMDAMGDEELRAAVQKHNVFARASPQNKIRIVKALQADGEVCAMTGDGTNDAPALKAADMGVAMGKEGTDVAREASEMILVDDNFASIVAAIREGRVVWDNLRKVLFVNTPINNAQGLSVLFGIALGLGYTPLSSIQVLYSNLITACTLGFVAAVEPEEDGIMDQPPRRVGKRLIGRFLLLRIVIATIALECAVLGSAFWTRNALGGGEAAMPYVRASALNALNFSAIGTTASARFTRKSAFHVRSFYGNPFAQYSYAIIIVLQFFVTYVPGVNSIIFSQTGMGAWQWGLTVLLAVGVFITMETEKCVRNYLTSLKYDTDDLELDEVFDQVIPEPEVPLPEEVEQFGKNQLLRH